MPYIFKINIIFAVCFVERNALTAIYKDEK